MLKRFFRKIPLPGKLFLLVLFPMALIVLLTLRVYNHNNEKVHLIRSYLEHIRLFSDLSATATQLQIENRRSFLYALKRDSSLHEDVISIRPVTDSLLRRLDGHDSYTIWNFRNYTFLDRLDSMRIRIDTDSTPVPDQISHYYTTSIFRLKSLIPGAAINNDLIDSVYEDLASARMLNDMFMYLGIIRLNFYSTLFRGQNNIPMLYGLRGPYEVMKSYEKELLTKSNPGVVDAYEGWRARREVNESMRFIDSVFAHFSFDIPQNAERWWVQSGAMNDQLRSIQDTILKKSLDQMQRQYGEAVRKRDVGLFVMIIALVAVLGYMFYTSRVVNSQLSSLDAAAQRIAVGEEADILPDKPSDVIGRLATSIEKIDSSNKQLAFAAAQIGRGNFDIEIRPRGDRDVLGMAVADMKDDLEEYIAEIREHERRKDDFIVMASHELKTPITSIKGYVQLLFALYHEYRRTKELPSEEAVSSSLSTIEKQINKLTRLLSELLDLSRIERGKLELEKKRFDLNELVRETIDEVRHTAPGREIILNDGNMAEVFGDRDRLGQVMLNLLTNALKYSRPPHPVIVGIDTDGKEVTVCVADQGIGIPAAEQQKIFERFYRVQGKSEQTYPGFGVGLYIAAEIVQRHGGKMNVKSEPGRGSEFSFTLEKL
jgi:signal transduction histidine kinase